MPKKNFFKKTNIVIAGAGFGGTYTYKQLHERLHGQENVALSLVNPRNYFLFTPLLHEVATGSVSPENAVEPLRKVLGCCLANFYQGNVTKVQTKDKLLETDAGDIPFDQLVLALGAQTNFYNTPGAEEYSFTLKSLDDALRLKNHFIQTFEKACFIHNPQVRQQMLSFVVIGGGPTGVELAAEMSEFFYDTFAKYYPQIVSNEVKITLIHKPANLLTQFAPKIQKQSIQTLRQKYVNIRLSSEVIEVGKNFVKLANGELIPTNTPIWVAGIKPAQIEFDVPVDQNESGKLIVNRHLQLKEHPNIFVLGDLAFAEDPTRGLIAPATAQVATQQATTVAENIYRVNKGDSLTTFFYRHKGDLISLGHWLAGVEIGRFSFIGHLVWWMYRGVYLNYLLSWPKKIEVAVDWFIDLFSPRDISEI